MAQTGLTVDFKTMTNGDFEIKCNLIVTSMTGNKNFPKPTPSVKELDAAAKKFSDASALAADGGRMQRRQRDAQREIVTGLLVELKAYVEYESKGDKIKLASSGFTLRGQKARHSANNEVKKFVIKHGKISGTIQGSFTNITWATSYGYEYTRTPINDANWKTISGGNCRFEIAGLDRGVEYAVRICAKSKTRMIYSTVLMILVV